MKRYQIGDRTYRLDELVLDQEEALTELLEPLYSAGETTAKGLVDGLLRQKLLRKALAVVLVPEGETVEAMDREAVAAHLGAHLTVSQQAQVIRDFFEVNAAAIAALKALVPGAAVPKGVSIN